MRRGLAVTDHAAKAAQQSADAATQAVALAKRTQPVTERAVVLIETVTASTPELERPTVVIFTLKNYGRTAAYSAKLTGFLTFRAGSEPIRDMPETTIAPQGANVWITKSIGLRMTQEQIDNVNAGNTAFRYQIEVTYLDAFENSHRYRVEGQYEAALRQFIITSSTSD